MKFPDNGNSVSGDLCTAFSPGSTQNAANNKKTVLNSLCTNDYISIPGNEYWILSNREINVLAFPLDIQ